MKIKRWLFVTFVALILLTNANAVNAEVMYSGTCGDHATWTLDSEGVLLIKGDGEMNDYEYGWVPWNRYHSMVKSVSLTSGITRIGNNTFANCENLCRISIPNSIINIGEFAFQGCNNLTEIIIPKSITEIEKGAFNGCRNLTSVTIPDGVLSIGEAAFADCNKLSSITIPESITIINNYMFQNCTNLISVVLPRGLKKIGNGTFESCKSLSTIAIPDSCTYIGNSAFIYCSNLKEILLPSCLSSVGARAFYDCENITSIIIPNKVISIGEEAFFQCLRLSDISFQGNAPSIGTNAFFNDKVQAEYPSEDKTWTSDVKQDYGGKITWILSEEEIHSDTVDGLDLFYVWSFANSNSEFPLATKGYYMNDADFKKLMNGLTLDDRKMVAGNIRPTIQKRLDYLSNDIWTEKINVENRGKPHSSRTAKDGTTNCWKGSCFGMCALGMLINNGVIKASSINQSSSGLYTIPENASTASIINFYHTLQHSKYITAKKAEFYELGVKNGQSTQLNEVKKLGEKSNKDGSFFLIAFNWCYHENGQWGTTGHVLMGYGYETGVWTFNNNKYTNRILTYDCSNPYNDLAGTCLYFDNRGQFCIPGYNVYSKTIDSKKDPTDNGKLTWVTGDANDVNGVNGITGKINPYWLQFSPRAYVITKLKDFITIRDDNTQETWKITISGSTSSNSNSKLTVLSEENQGEIAAEATYAIVFPNDGHKYTIDSEGENLECQLVTGGHVAEIKTGAPGLMTFGSDGSLYVKVDRKTSITAASISNDIYKNTNWNEVSVAGDTLSEITIQPMASGVMIQTDTEQAVKVIKSSETASYIQSRNDTKKGILINKETDKTVQKGKVITIGNLKYKVTNANMTGQGSVILVGITSKEKTYTIPATIIINGIAYKVNAIADNTFKNNKTVTSVTIGANIKKIGKNAFQGCTNLKKVKGCKAVTSIESNAFSGDKKLSSMALGLKLTTIGNKAFYKCFALTKITIPSRVKSIGRSAFQFCKKLKTITIKSTKLTSKKVKAKAFAGTPSNTMVKLPKKVKKAYKKWLVKKGISKKAKIR